MSITKLSEEQESILIGSMLGDGHLELDRKNRSINARLTIRRAIKDASYLLWEHSVFEEFCSEKAIREYVEFDFNTEKYHHGISLSSGANTVFTPYYERWYSDIKRVPRDLILDSLVMLIWFLDDGWIQRTKSGKLAISLATHGFVLEDNQFLHSLLENRYQQEFSIQEAKNKDGTKKYHYLYGYGNSADAIIKDIEDIYPYGIMSRKAIWAHAYDDALHTFDIKREKIAEYMQDRDDFFLNDLGRYAGFEFQRKSKKPVKGKKFNRGGRTEVATTSLKRHYLHDYIEQGLIIELGKDIKYHNGIKYQLTDHGKVYFSERSIIT